MVLKEIMGKIAGLGQQQEVEEIDDEETKDKVLRSLRRERRIQMEGVEKERLQKDIRGFKKDEMRKNMFGINEKSQPNPDRLKSLAIKRRIDILKQRQGQMITKQGLVSKKGSKPASTSKERKKQSFLGKSNLI